MLRNLTFPYPFGSVDQNLAQTATSALTAHHLPFRHGDVDQSDGQARRTVRCVVLLVTVVMNLRADGLDEEGLVIGANRVGRHLKVQIKENNSGDVKFLRLLDLVLGSGRHHPVESPTLLRMSPGEFVLVRVVFRDPGAQVVLVTDFLAGVRNRIRLAQTGIDCGSQADDQFLCRNTGLYPVTDKIRVVIDRSRKSHLIHDIVDHCVLNPLRNCPLKR